MAQQGQVEGAHPRRVSGQGRGRRGCHPPARVGGAGCRIGVHPQQQRGDARLLRRQRQAAAGGQVQLRRAAPDFEQQRAKGGASQGFDRRPQQHRLVPHRADQQMRRVDPQSRKAGSIRRGLTRGCGGTQPQGHGVRPGKAREDQRKSGGRRLSAFAGEKFMHPAARQSSAQRPVDQSMAKRDMGMMRHAPAFQRSDAPSKGGKGRGRLDHVKCSSFVLFMGE